MAFTVLPQLKTKILEQYESNMAIYPQKRGEVESFLREKDETFSLCLKFLYGHLPVIDVVSFSVAQIAGFVEASLEAYERIDYVCSIPQDIFFSYVLSHRVNSECLDCSRGVLMEEILPHVQGKTMEQAALAVNYWCYSYATYTPADDRTLGPLAIMRRALGRCGEESVLAVSALRSVGIPARQCYCPRWSHCDDNHAWVEVWIDGSWHYLGACEPEPVLDKGWFTAAASRAMLVHTKCWSNFDETKDVAYETPLYGLVNCTALYAELRTLTVRVLENGLPVQGAAVAFQIVNYSELYTLYQDRTDENGLARFETGLGDLCVYIFLGGRMLLKKVDMRCQEGVLELDLADGFTLDAMPLQLQMDLVPPVGKSDVSAAEENPIHEANMRACEEKRAAFMATFCKPEGQRVSAMALREAAGNWPQVQAFLNDERYSLAEKEQILSTLRPKDFVDITCDVLFDALDTAETVRGQYPEDIFRDTILAPRIADEMLLPERAKIRALFPEGFANAGEILAWMRENVQIVEDYDVDNYYPSAYGCLYYRQSPAYSFDMVFVALCRAFRFPARLAPDTREGQWLDETGAWQSVRIHQREETVQLCLANPTGKTLTYFEHMSLGYWDGNDFASLQYWDLPIGERYVFPVRPGLYRLVTTTRQIDGTASVLLRHIQVEQDMTVTLELPPDQTAQRLKQETLVLREGPVKDALRENAGSRRILVFAEPGSEPTEHLLQEMLQCAEGFNGEDCQIRIFVDKPETLQNATLQRVSAALHKVEIRACRDPDAEAALHRIMQVGDLRKPFVISVDEKERGVYATANYNIRMAQTLLMIQKLIAGGK